MPVSNIWVIIYILFIILMGAVMVVILWELDFQLPMKSVPITTIVKL